MEGGKHTLPFCISSLCLGREHTFVKSGGQNLTSRQAQAAMGMNVAVWVTVWRSNCSGPKGGPPKHASTHNLQNP